ncbi:uncharacterized protein C8Q71DRAFT_790106 [Rhodofomes roseus]|uniref:Uncharacterized protein n=1 Tax=Rhodofomes roseus TaxID=34475 RepID=A0ABQ8JZC9_9APHY|nr:uncharacterized protein C8Q71DRAFT_790106 [Rhodofomes roseus]KAH9829421.1 hypothetical protein C8Q71DRAFT_790106 [Rhodofomes roseus]
MASDQQRNEPSHAGQGDTALYREVERARHAAMRRLHNEQVPLKKIAKFFGCSKRTVRRVCTNDRGEDLSEDQHYVESWDATVTDVDALDHTPLWSLHEAGSARADLHPGHQSHAKGEEESDDIGLESSGESDQPDDDPDYTAPDPEPPSWLLSERRVSARLRQEPAPYVRTSLSPDAVLRMPRYRSKPTGSRRHVTVAESDPSGSAATLQHMGPASMSRALSVLFRGTLPPLTPSPPPESPGNMGMSSPQGRAGRAATPRINGQVPGARIESTQATFKVPLPLPRTPRSTQSRAAASGVLFGRGTFITRRRHGAPYSTSKSSTEGHAGGQLPLEISLRCRCVVPTIHFSRLAAPVSRQSQSSQESSSRSIQVGTRTLPTKRQHDASSIADEHGACEPDGSAALQRETKRTKLGPGDSTARAREPQISAAVDSPRPTTSDVVADTRNVTSESPTPTPSSSRQGVVLERQPAEGDNDGVPPANIAKSEADVEHPQSGGSTPAPAAPSRAPPRTSTAQRGTISTEGATIHASRNVLLPPAALSGSSSLHPSQSPDTCEGWPSSQLSPIAARSTAPGSHGGREERVDRAGPPRDSVGSASSTQTLSPDTPPASAAHKSASAARDNIDPDVRRYLESLGFAPEMYASKLEVVGLKNGAIINAIKNFVPESRKDKLEEDLQRLAGLTVGESIGKYEPQTPGLRARSARSVWRPANSGRIAPVRNAAIPL